ncbi:MAG: helix-turn-helix domain-containing protein [Gammaproteobacteria bacterium]|nr:helix-turn-helix domain-containing protein [Gammaproteobacteria bacterium]
MSLLFLILLLFLQAQLAEAVDVSRKSINAVENGVYIPSTVLALKIAKTLNSTVQDLFELTE